MQTNSVIEGRGLLAPGSRSAIGLLTSAAGLDALLLGDTPERVAGFPGRLRTCFPRNVSDPPDIRIIAQDLLIRRAPLQGQRVLCWDWTTEAR